MTHSVNQWKALLRYLLFNFACLSHILSSASDEVRNVCNRLLLMERNCVVCLSPILLIFPNTLSAQNEDNLICFPSYMSVNVDELGVEVVSSLLITP